MISREFAERYFPAFVVRVEEEMALAKERAIVALNGIPNDLEDILHYVRVNNNNTGKDKPKTHEDRVKDQEIIIETVASMANLGFSKEKIVRETNLKLNSIRHYLQIAREKGLVDKDLIVHTKDRGLPSRQERNGR